MIVVLAALLTLFGMSVVGCMDMLRLKQWTHEAQIAADAGALAGASAFIDGTPEAVRGRVEYYVAANLVGNAPGQLDSMVVNADAGTVTVYVGYDSGPIFYFFPNIHVAARSGSKAELTNNTGNIGSPVPQGNAWGWWKKDHDKVPGAVDSAGIKLNQ